MNGKTHKMRRRLSVVALAASLAAVAVPAASAGGKYFAPGSNTVEKHGPYGVYWVPMQRVLGPSLNTVEKRGPYGAYWVRKNTQSKNTLVDSSSVVDRQLGSPDPRDSMAGSLLKPGSSIIQDVASEHGAAGFGNSISVDSKPSSVDYSHLPAEDRP